MRTDIGFALVALVGVELAMIESVARQAGVSMVDAAQAVESALTRHGADQPSTASALAMIAEAVREVGR